MSEQEWSVVFYVDPSGVEPVRGFLGNLDRKTRARFDWAIEQLCLRNVQAGEPLVRHLEGKLWELRRESDTNIYRLIYCFHSNRRIRLSPRLPEEDAEDSSKRDRDCEASAQYIS